MAYVPFAPNPSVTPDAVAPIVPFQNGQYVANDAALKAIATATVAGVGGIPVGSWVRVGHVLGGSTIWTLIAGVHADSPATGFSEPTDYNAGTNQKYWQQLGFPY